MARKVSKQRGDPIFELTVDEVRTKWDSLTPREQFLVALYAKGSTNKVIAEESGISLKTLDVHRSNIRRKLGTRPWGFGRYYFAAKSLNLPAKEAAA